MAERCNGKNQSVANEYANRSIKVTVTAHRGFYERGMSWAVTVTFYGA
jgi:hypothetical protein